MTSVGVTSWDGVALRNDRGFPELFLLVCCIDPLCVWNETVRSDFRLFDPMNEPKWAGRARFVRLIWWKFRNCMLSCKRICGFSSKLCTESSSWKSTVSRRLRLKLGMSRGFSRNLEGRIGWFNGFFFQEKCKGENKVDKAAEKKVLDYGQIRGRYPVYPG